MKCFGKCIIILLLGLVTACFLLCLVNLIFPKDTIRENLKKDTEYFLYKENLNPILGYSYPSYDQDIFCDGLILKTCIYDSPEHGFLDRVFGCYIYKYEGYESSASQDILLDLNRGYTGNGNEHIDPHDYAYGRYWHGQRIVLMPLLTFMTYRDVMILGLFVQLSLIISLAVLVYRNHGWMALIPVALLYYLLNPVAIATSVQYHNIFYITVGSLIILESFGDRLLGNYRYVYMFVLIGMLVSLFDFLTYPMVAAGVPMVWFLAFTLRDAQVAERIRAMFICGISWCMGFALFWMSKWPIAAITSHYDVAGNGLEMLGNYTDSGRFGPWEAIKANYGVLLKKPYIAMLVAVLCVFIVLYIRRGFDKTSVRNVIPIVIMALLPVAWYIFASTHSYLHAYMTHRNTVVSFFALAVVGVLLIQGRRGTNDTDAN